MNYIITPYISTQIVESFIKEFHLPFEIGDKVFQHCMYKFVLDKSGHERLREVRDNIICTCTQNFLEDVKNILKENN